jgi:DNA-binding NarL/FixJ family response regulator
MSKNQALEACHGKRTPPNLAIYLLMSKNNAPPSDWQSLTLSVPTATFQRLDHLRQELGYETMTQVAREAVEWFLRVRVAHEARAVTGLTPRLLEVLQWIGKGLSSKQIAAKLGISLKTVEMHRAHLMKSLDIHGVAGLVRFAIRTGIVRLDD